LESAINASGIAEKASERKGVLKIVTNSMGMKFVLIPAGRFTMGCPSSESGRYDDEGPQHEEVRSKK
jgi:formylglycine-generating enzyme required for sulfatase activity